MLVCLLYLLITIERVEGPDQCNNSVYLGPSGRYGTCLNVRGAPCRAWVVIARRARLDDRGMPNYTVHEAPAPSACKIGHDFDQGMGKQPVQAYNCGPLICMGGCRAGVHLMPI